MLVSSNTSMSMVLVNMRSVLVFALIFVFSFEMRNAIATLTEVSDDDVLRKWYQMEDNLENGIDMLVKKMLPKINDISSNVNLTKECGRALFKLILDFKHMKMWALKMFDASSGKTPGFLDGASVSLGDYEQCLKITINKDQSSEEQFHGQYCLVDFRPTLPKKRKNYYYKGELVQPFGNFTPRTELFRSFKYRIAVMYAYGIRFGICIPSACNMDDVNNIISATSSSMRLNGIVMSCKTKKEITWDYAIIAVISVLVTYLLIVVICTVIDIYFQDATSSVYVRAFSMKRNLQRALRVEECPPDSDTSHFHGVRFFSMAWVVCGHSAYGLNPYKTRFSSTLISKIVGNFWLQFVVNGFISVDTFFFLSAVLSAYGFAKSLDKHGKKVFNWPILILRRVYRLLPAIMVVLGLQFVLYPLNDGPNWDESILAETQVCKRRWWTILTFTHNLVDICETCLPHAWYVSLAMQFFCLTIFYFYLLINYSRLANLFLGLLFLTTPVVNVALSLWYNFPPTLYSAISTRKEQCRFMHYTYLFPHAHVAIHAMGLFLGILLARKKERFELKKRYKALGWILFALFNGLIVYGPYTWHQVHSRAPSKFAVAFYNGFHRIGWGFALSWLTTQCATGSAGVINSFLSWKIFSTLNRPSYMVYLVHVLVLKFFFSSLYGPIDGDPNTLVMRFCGTLLFSYLLAFVLHIIYESPLIHMDKIWFKLNTRENSQPGAPQVRVDTLTLKRRKEENNINISPNEQKTPNINDVIKFDNTNL